MRTQATLLSFVFVFAAYLVYGWVLVPMVLPNIERVEGPTTAENDDDDPIRLENAHFLELLPADGWERNSSRPMQTLRLGQTLVFFSEDKREGKTLRVEPCTILLLPDGFREYRDDEETQKLLRQSIVFQSPGFAEIEFDADFDLFDISNRSVQPNFVAGRFWGKVTVRKGSSTETDVPDDFSLETESIEIRAEEDVMTISTLRDVRFQFGLHTGEGTGLTLRLAQSPQSPQTHSQQSLSQMNKELQSVVVARLKSLRLVFPEDNSTMDVRCQQNFVFAANPAENGWTGSFFQNVEMVRNNADRTADRLTAEEVHLTLSASGNAKTPSNTSNNKVSPFDGLEPALFVARGKPGSGTQLPVPARLAVKKEGDVMLVGDEIFLNLRENFLQLSTRKEAGASPFVEMIIAGQYTIRSEQSIRYTLGEEGAIGKLLAEGKGNMTGRVGEGAAAKDMRLDWNTMQMEPHPTIKDQIILKLDNGIAARMTGFGTMTAQQLELHCVVVPSRQPSAAPSGAIPSGAALSGTGGQTNSLMLDQITVRNNVFFETDSGTCRVNQLHIFFTNLAPDGTELHSSRMLQSFAQAPIPPGRAAAAPQPVVRQPIQQVQHLQPLTLQNPVQPIPLYQPSAPPVAAAPMMRSTPTPRTAPRGNVESQNLMGIQSSPGGGKFDITGNLMRMRVRMQSGQSSAENIEITGDVRLQENVAHAAAHFAIEIIGDSVMIWDPADPTTKIQITGRATSNDAILKGRGVELRAKELKLSREDNIFWSPGPGQLIAHTAHMNTPGIPAGNTNLVHSNDDKLYVEWNKEMRCDGKVLQFWGQQDSIGNRVNVMHQTKRLWCDQMEIHLNRQVLFFDDPSTVTPEAVEIRCAGRVEVKHQLFDASGKQKSQDSAKAERLLYHLPRNYIFAAGPGELTSVFVSSAQGFDSTQTAGPPVPNNQVSNNQERLVHLAVWFPDEMQGILLGNKKEVEFKGRKVYVAYCPAANWNDRIDIGNFAAARLRGYTLECERLKIEEIPNPINPSESFFELMASETAIVEGSGIFGRAQTIRYNQAKNTVDFEGNVSAQRSSQGQNISVGPAERVIYNIETGNFDIIRMRHGLGIQ